MAATLRHRGPDAAGSWVDAAQGVALGHTRLSVIDLSPAGAQPMESSEGRLVITYNGEIYNHAEIREELLKKGRKFRGHSDTEVILEAFAEWGIEEVLPRLIGMFAFGVWDRQTRQLTLARDPLGIKPLYWAQFPGLFLFGSELKALRAHPGWAPSLDRDAAAAYMRYGYVPAPWTIYKGVWKLQPGSVLSVGGDASPMPRRYWDLRRVAAIAVRKKRSIAPAEAAERLEYLLSDSVRRQMIADVPVGAFLSGGIDSSTVVALMQKESQRPVRTFSIGFSTPGFDEAVMAKAVARHLGTNHTELYIAPSQALDVIPSLAEWYDEPNADSSQIPTYLVSKITREEVTVALTGDGGDELFGGYRRYRQVRRSWNAVAMLPPIVRQAAKNVLGTTLRAMASGTLGPPPILFRTQHKLRRLLEILPLQSPDEVNRLLISLWSHPEKAVCGGIERMSPFFDPTLEHEIPDVTERMQLQDALVYLPDDILAKVDRASMAVSLEVRVPLLDHRVAEFAWELPPALKFGGGIGKRVLKDVLYRHVPRSLVDRPKMGFTVPIDEWLRGPLREWAETLLSEHELRRGEVLNPCLIRRRWTEHLAGVGNWGAALWGILTFQAWKARWLPA